MEVFQMKAMLLWLFGIPASVVLVVYSLGVIH